MVLAGEAEALAGEQPLDDLDAFVHAPPARLRADAPGLELLDLVTEAETELQAPAGDDVERGGVLGHADRVVQRQQQEARADVDFARARGDGAADGEPRRRVAILEKVMLGEPDVVYETLEQSSQGWHEGKHDPWPYINYVLFILKTAYKEFAERVGDIKAPRGAKTDQTTASSARQVFDRPEP